MTTTTPPGWYPDPEQAGNGPVRELWWDGAVWTGRSRIRGAARGPLVAGATGLVVLAASLIVGGVLLSGPGSGDAQDDKKQGGSGSSAEPTGPPQSAAVIGVELPVLPGWQREPDGTATGTGPYPCPGEGGGECFRGASAVVPAWPGADGQHSPREVAAQDIRRNADSAYGGITGHEPVASGRTTVAGEPGYRIRWRAHSRTGPDGYVESVAFAHPDGSGQILVLRTSIDVHRDAPSLRDMDRLSAGVRWTDGEIAQT